MGNESFAECGNRYLLPILHVEHRTGLQHEELHSGHDVLERFLASLLHLEVVSRSSLGEIRLFEKVEDFAFKRFVGVVPKGPHFFEVLLVEVCHKSSN